MTHEETTTRALSCPDCGRHLGEGIVEMVRLRCRNCRDDVYFRLEGAMLISWTGKDLIR